ncbi:YIP1 family protein [Pseudooceanicola sp. 502str34]
MSILRDIAATYRRPGAVLRRHLRAGEREDRALATLMAGCLLIFVAQWPRLSREAFLTGEELSPLLGSTLMAWVFLAPLLLYGIAALAHVVARIASGRGTFYTARMALFWSILAAAPVLLLHGMVAGFIGPGPALDLVGLAWLAIFLWFWIAGMRVAEWPLAPDGAATGQE